MIKKLILSIAVLMLAASTTMAQPTADNLGVNDASGNQGTYVLVPVNITNIQNGPIAGIFFTLNFNSSVINLTKARVTLGDLTSAWDQPSVNPITGIVALNFAGAGTEIPNGTSGSVAVLNFSVIGSPGATSNMTISAIQLADPDGNLGTTAPAKNGIFTVTVPGSVLTTITVTPNPATVASGNTQTFTAAGFDQNSNTTPISPAVFWSSGNTTVGTIDNSTGMFTANLVGTTTITARNGSSGTVSGTATVTVIGGGASFTIAANRTNVSIIAGLPISPTPVLFTVMQSGAPATGATVTLNGAATGSGTTAADGTVVLMVSPTSNGTITATATLGGNTTMTTLTAKGDVNGDGQVTIVDALFIAQYTVAQRTLSPAQLAAADVNGDGQVNIVDALFIAQATVGISDRPVPRAGN